MSIIMRSYNNMRLPVISKSCDLTHLLMNITKMFANLMAP